MSEQAKNTITPSLNPQPGWKETGILGVFALLEMVFGALLVGVAWGDPPRSVSAMILAITIGGILLLLLTWYFFARKGSSPQHVYTGLSWIIFILLTTILISGIYGSNTTWEMTGAFLLVVLMFCLTFAFFIYYFDKIVTHPVIKEIEDKVSKLSDQANTSLEIANKIFMPHSLISQGGLILGTSHEEMMARCFHDYINDARAIRIKFMGTTYGAFANGEAKSYGFLNALERHVDACSQNEPFVELKGSS